MGQGMVSADHILPKEYTDGLRLLQDKALRRQRNEVRFIYYVFTSTNISNLFDRLVN